MMNDESAEKRPENESIESDNSRDDGSSETDGDQEFEVENASVERSE